MKSLLVIVLISFFLASCGKNNSTSSGVATNTGVNPVTSAVSTASYDEFKVAVNNGSFVAQSYTKEAYYYSNTSSQQSTILWGLVNVNSSTSSGSMNRIANKATDVYTHELGTSAAAIKAGIVSIMNSATNHSLCYSNRNNCYVVYTNASYTEGYVIDLAYPIAANPLAKISTSGSGYTMVGVRVLAQ